MLASCNRLTTADDYKRAIRRGRRYTGDVLIAHAVLDLHSTESRFGFIVARNVGGAVVRNHVRRRLKAACFDLSEFYTLGSDVVFRAYPAAAAADFKIIRRDVEAVLRQISQRR